EVRAKMEAAHAKAAEKLGREQAKREQARADENAKVAEKLARDQAKRGDTLRDLQEELEGARAKRNKLREAGRPDEAERADVVVEDLKRRIAELESKGGKGDVPAARRNPKEKEKEPNKENYKEKETGRAVGPRPGGPVGPGAGPPPGAGIEDIGAIRREVREL